MGFSKRNYFKHSREPAKGCRVVGITGTGSQTVFISHGDCRADAEYVADLVREKFGTQDIRIHSIGPVIGSHSGPGTVALFYLGRTRG